MTRPRKTRSRHRDKPDPLARTIGQRVRRLRLASGFTFDAFVEETGLGRGYISELERGMVVPTITTLDRIARALELTVADLVVGESPREQLFEVARSLDDASILRMMRTIEPTVPSDGDPN